MYERIQSARTSHISYIEDDTVQAVKSNDFDDYYDDDDRTSADAEDESEGIFEFDF